jgi:hypothetical protein
MRQIYEKAVRFMVGTRLGDGAAVGVRAVETSKESTTIEKRRATHLPEKRANDRRGRSNFGHCD